MIESGAASSHFEPPEAPAPGVHWSDRRYLGALLVILVAGAVLRLHGLGAQAFDCDELYAVGIRGSFWRDAAAVLGRVMFHEPHPPLSSLAYLGWVSVFGESEVAVRSLPALLGLVGIALIAATGRRIADPPTGLAAAAFFAINPLQVAYAQEARPYAPAVTLVLAAHLFFLRSLSGAHPRDRVVYATLVAASVYTHYFALLALLPHGVLALWAALRGAGPARAAAKGTLLASSAGMLTFLAWGPALFFQMTARPQGQDLTIYRVRSVKQVGSWLAEVSGLGTLPVLLLATAASAALLVAACGVREPMPTAARLPLAGDSPPGRRTGLLALAAAPPAGVILLLAARRAAPFARDLLATHGYAPATIERELRAMAQFALSVPLTLVVVGGLLFSWRQLSRRLDGLARNTRGPAPSQGAALALLLGVPLLACTLLGLAGASIFSARNLLLFQPALALALGRGAVRMARAPLGRLALPPLIVCLGAAALQYQPISWTLGMPGMPIGKRSAPWRELDRALAASGPHAGLLLAHAPNTNPALFYLARHGVERVERPAGLATLPIEPGLLFVHLTGDRWSEPMLAALSASRELVPRIRIDELVVFEVGGRARHPTAGAPDPGVKIAPRRVAPPPTPTPQQGGFPP